MTFKSMELSHYFDCATSLWRNRGRLLRSHQTLGNRSKLFLISCTELEQISRPISLSRRFGWHTRDDESPRIEM